jgi:hypothetical protein
MECEIRGHPEALYRDISLNIVNSRGHVEPFAITASMENVVFVTVLFLLD